MLFKKQVLFYLGLPRSGSSSLFKYIQSRHKAHEIDIDSVINTIYRTKCMQEEDRIETFMYFLNLRKKNYDLAFDICTIYSFAIRDVLLACPNDKYLCILRSPIEWAYSFIRYSQIVFLDRKSTYNSKFWQLVADNINPANTIRMTNNIEAMADTYNDLLEIWENHTSEILKYMLCYNSLLLKLDNINKNLNSLNTFLGTHNINSDNIFPCENTSKSLTTMNNKSPNKKSVILDQICTILSGHSAFDLYHSIPSIVFGSQQKLS